MIYLFVGEKYFREKLLSTWKGVFEKKYSSLNIIEVKNYLDFDINFYNQIFFSSGFFSEKSFIIINDFSFDIGEKDEQIQKLTDYYLENIQKISSENTIVFNNFKVDKRSKLYKLILKIGEIKDFSINDEKELISKINQLYSNNVSIKALNKLIELKGLNFSNIKNELDKLFITLDYIDLGNLNLVNKDIEENIFEIINDVINLNLSKSIIKIRDLSNFLDNHYLLYNMLCSNFRFYFYLFLLKSQKKSSKEIQEILPLGNRAFLVDKNYKIDHNSFFTFYKNLAFIDEKIKTGKMLGSENIDMLYEIEKNILKIKSKN